MSSRLKQRVGALAAGVAMSAFTLTGFANVAQAQNLLDADVGVNEQVGNVVGVENDTLTNEGVAEADQPLVGGAVESTTEVAAPAAPVESEVSVDAPVAVDEVVGQDVCLNAGVNAPAGECGTTAPGTPVATDPVPDEVVNVDVDGTVQVDEPLIPVQSGTDVVADAGVAPVAAADVCLGLGVNEATGECNAPAMPAEPPASTDGAPITGDVDAGAGVEAPLPVGAEAVVDTGAVVDEVAIADVCVDASVNGQTGACEQSVPGGADMPPTGTGLVDGDAVAVVEADAPLPVEGNATAEAEAAFDDLVDAAGICADVGINDETGACADEGAGDPGAETGNDGNLIADADVTNEAEVNAPLPVEAETGANTGIVADEIADVGVCLDASVNRNADNCEAADSGDGNSGDGQPADDPIVDGNVDGGTEIEAPLPVEAGVETNANAAMEDIAGVDACADVSVNQSSDSCGENAPNAPGDGGSDPGDGADGDTGNTNDSGDADNVGNAPGDGNTPGGADNGGLGDMSDSGDADDGNIGEISNSGAESGDSGNAGGLDPGSISNTDGSGSGVSGDGVSGGGVSDGSALGGGTSGLGGVDLISSRASFAAVGAGSEGGEDGAGGSSNADGETSGSGSSGDAAASERAVAGELPDTGGFSVSLLMGASLIGFGLCLFVAASRRRRIS